MSSAGGGSAASSSSSAGGAAPALPTVVVIHPIVLLSVVDHYTRVAEGTQRRVVGVLLGSVKDTTVDVTNCYALPFEEDARNSKIWFVDHNFHEKMFAMFRKVNASERVVGWYSSGPRIRDNDIDINELFRKYTREPVLCIIEAKSTELGLPTKSYVSVEKVGQDGVTSMAFSQVESRIGAVEAEEVGVEHLLRDIHDASAGTLTTQVSHKVLALRSLHERLRALQDYLQLLQQRRLPVSRAVLDAVQDAFNLLPSLSQQDMVSAFATKTNDSTLALYVASLVRTVVALHDLINNRIESRDYERKTFGFAKDEAPGEKKKDEKKDEKKDKAAATQEQKK